EPRVLERLLHDASAAAVRIDRAAREQRTRKQSAARKQRALVELAHRRRQRLDAARHLAGREQPRRLGLHLAASLRAARGEHALEREGRGELEIEVLELAAQERRELGRDLEARRLGVAVQAREEEAALEERAHRGLDL